MLSIRRSVYRGDEGFSIVGSRDRESWPVRVFVKGRREEDRRAAEWIKERIRLGDREWRFEDAYRAAAREEA